ncbi:hypothetical protein K504DRAFT_452767 [Pleomassaria siparia CBS 279.74]|uniref:Uncharacterized protein n=1 Tax=Pleomassaria siparia CBS 279.74 TaxID=1314801 RepID=A0A6G1KJ02_9PLEO|nr:hypothetical protein K504DRAFT_452767 [Pleomassaria siparia CBS 279.74]
MTEPMSALSPEKLNSDAKHSIATNDDDQDISWREPPSSPFISHVEHEDQENIAPADVFPTTPIKPLADVNDDAPQSVFKISSPFKTPRRLKERNSPMKMSPSKPSLEDDDFEAAMMEDGTKSRGSPMKMSPSKPLLEDDFEAAMMGASTKSRGSPMKMSPSKPLLEDDFEAAMMGASTKSRGSPMKGTPVRQLASSRPASVSSNRSTRSSSPTKTSHAASTESAHRTPEPIYDTTFELAPSTAKRPSFSHQNSALRDNEGLTVAMKGLEETQRGSHERATTYHTGTEPSVVGDMGIDDADYNPDGHDFTSLDMGMDDTCFSNFSEMPGIDMTKFAALRKSPTRNGMFDQETPRASRIQMTPATARRTERRPHQENDTTNLLLDFTAQIEAFSASRRNSPSHGRPPHNKSSTEPNLLSYIQSQRSPAKGSFVPSTPNHNRQGLLNLLDFELPPPPTPRSVPTVTIRELESLKSTFQSQISSLSASLSGKEAQIESLVKAIADAERRVGEAQENLRDERSARDYAEAQMVDWKKKGEEVQNLLKDVQSEMAHNDSERENLLGRISEFERRIEDAEARASELETRAIEAESRNVDMTTFINPDDTTQDRKIYSEIECQTAIAEKVNEVARDLHAAYKAKHEKKIKALKENYQRKADERCKELRVQIIRLERQVEESEKKRDDTFSKVLPPSATSKDDGAPSAPVSDPEDLKRLEAQKFELENIKAKLAGLQSELTSLHKTNEALQQDLEHERVEKADLVHAAEEMLAMCAAQMEEKQQDDLRKSTVGGAPPSVPPASEHSANAVPSKRPGSALSGVRPGSGMSDRLGEMGTKSVIAKPSGLRAPGGFGFQPQRTEMSRSTSGNKSRIMNNIERMGGGRTQE